MKRKLIVRLILAAVYAAILVLMLVTGRRHTILIDNADAADGSYVAVEGMEVMINRLESSEYYPGDRDKAEVKGQRHRITVELFMEGRTEQRDFTLPFGQDMVLLSVPAMLAGVEPWIQPFTVRQEQQSLGEDTESNQSLHFGGDIAEEPEALPQ